MHLPFDSFQESTPQKLLHVYDILVSTIYKQRTTNKKVNTLWLNHTIAKYIPLKNNNKISICTHMKRISRLRDE